MSNITQVVRTDKHMMTLRKGIIASGLDQLLSTAGPFTIFAPSDRAFEKLGKEAVENLLNPGNKLQLTHLLNHHIVKGKINFKDLKDGEKLKTLGGIEILVTVAGGNVRVDGVAIQRQDVKTSNGVIHPLDTVMSN